MAEDTSVKFFSSNMFQAPVLKGNTITSVRDLIQACLVTGFGESIATSGTVTAGVCRINVAEGKSISMRATANITGVSNKTGCNGEHKVTNAGTNWFEFNTEEPDGPLTGTITVKYAPAGWEMPFAYSGNNAVFRSTDLTSSRYYLRLEESSYNSVRVYAYRTMTGPTTGTEVMPFSGSYYWGKSTNSDASQREWTIIASKSFFYYLPRPYGTIAQYAIQSSAGAVFGDMIKEINRPYSSGYFTGLLGLPDTNYANNQMHSFEGLGSSRYATLTAFSVARSVRGEYGNFRAATYALVPPPLNNYPFSCNMGSAISINENQGLDLRPFYVQVDGQIVGRIPGASFVFNKINLPINDIVHDFTTNRDYLVNVSLSSDVSYYYQTAGSMSSKILIDITGPWE